ncbi:MAG: DUF429 domain-containing protein [Caulobacteraceae bacterium]|nr:DUF429 domain-containing protein [Caulobacteraceae bacterium]
MIDVAGIDGTKAGWVVVQIVGQDFAIWSAPDIVAALGRLGPNTLVAIDMPIGFPDEARRGGRDCEKLARAAMPGRGSSVFGSPCRAALGAADYEEACLVNRASSLDGLALSKQAHALFPKMREIDSAITPELQARVFEVHPELCFATLAASMGTTIRHSKKDPEGFTERWALLVAAGFPVDDLLAVRKHVKAQADDVLDAAVSAWTAVRRAQGSALRHPEVPPRDSRGLLMEMWA